MRSDAIRSYHEAILKKFKEAVGNSSPDEGTITQSGGHVFIECPYPSHQEGGHVLAELQAKSDELELGFNFALDAHDNITLEAPNTLETATSLDLLSVELHPKPTPARSKEEISAAAERDAAAIDRHEDERGNGRY